MTKNAATSVFVLTLTAALTAPAQAQDPGALQRCRMVGEAAARLACYDAIKLPASAVGAAAGVRATPVVAAAVVAPPTASLPAPLSAPLSAPSAVPVVEPSPAPVAPTSAQFGLEGKNTSAELSQIESQLLGEFEGWDAHTVFRLANGQAWQVSDDSNASYALRSPKVTIRRGVFGAFYLEVDGAKRSPRVKRLK